MAHQSFFSVLSLKTTFYYMFAGVAELADALDLGSSAARRGGSTPFTRTINFHLKIMIFLRIILFIASLMRSWRNGRRARLRA